MQFMVDDAIAAGRAHAHDYEASGAAADAIASHLADGDPHAQYMTQAACNAAYASADHGHAISGVTGLQTALDGKQAAGSYAAAAHTHTSVDVTDFTAAARAQVEATLVAGANITLTPAGSGASRTLTVAAAAGGAPTVLALAIDHATLASVAPISLTGLSFDYAANSTYRLWAMGRVQPVAATTGCGFQFDLSSAVTAIDAVFYHQLANTGTLSGGHSIADDASVGVSSGMPGTATYPVVLDGLLVTGASAGTAQLRFRSETTAITTCKAGFRLVIEKIQ